MRLPEQGVGRHLIKRPLPPTFRVQINHDLLVFADDAVVPGQTQPFRPLNVLHLQNSAHTPFDHLRLRTFSDLETALTLQIQYDFLTFRRHGHIPENDAAPLGLVSGVSGQANLERLLILISNLLLVESEHVPHNLEILDRAESVHYTGLVGVGWREK